MNVYIEEAFFIFVSLIALINPISAAAVFATLTEGRSPADQAAIARRASIVAAIALIAFAFAGEALLNALGVKLGAFKIAGGLLLLKVAFEMVFAPTTHRDAANKALADAPPASDPSVFPLAIPLITGPGALTASVALMDLGNSHNYISSLVFVIVALVVIGINYLFMLGSERLTSRFGTTGIDAVSRIVGIVVAAIAVQLVVDGVSSLTHFKMG